MGADHEKVRSELMENGSGTYAVALGMLASTPASLLALLAPLPPDLWTWSPAPGEWTLQEALTHMLHVETKVIPVRVRQMIAQDGAPLANADPAAAPTTPAKTLKAWLAAREENLTFLRTLTLAQLEQGGEHSHYGRITAREHIIEWAYHDLDHLRQLQATIEAWLYPGIGGFRALYSAPYPTGE
jgi:hypothetical protein